MQKKGKINNDERKDKICETTVRSKIDFGKFVFNKYGINTLRNRAGELTVYKLSVLSIQSERGTV